MQDARYILERNSRIDRCDWASRRSCPKSKPRERECMRYIYGRRYKKRVNRKIEQGKKENE